MGAGLLRPLRLNLFAISAIASPRAPSVATQIAETPAGENRPVKFSLARARSAPPLRAPSLTDHNSSRSKCQKAPRAIRPSIPTKTALKCTILRNESQRQENHTEEHRSLGSSILGKIIFDLHLNFIVDKYQAIKASLTPTKVMATANKSNSKRGSHRSGRQTADGQYSAMIPAKLVDRSRWFRNRSSTAMPRSGILIFRSATENLLRRTSENPREGQRQLQARRITLTLNRINTVPRNSHGPRESSCVHPAQRADLFTPV